MTTASVPRIPWRPRLRPAWVTMVGAALMITACSGSGKVHPQTGTSAAAPTSASSLGQAGASIQASEPAPGSAPLSSPAAGAGLTTQVDTTAGLTGAPEVETVTDLLLHRANGILQLDAVIRCDQPARGQNGCTDIGSYSGTSRDVESDGSLAGVEFLDGSALKTYLAIRGANNHPWSSTVPEFLPAGQQLRVWLRLAAPPTSVTAGTLLFPHGGPRLTDVPIVDSALPVEPTATAFQPGPDGVLAASPVRESPPIDTESLAGLTVPVRSLSLTVTKSTAETDVITGSKQDARLSADVLFAFGKSTLNPAATLLLSGVASRIAASVTGQVAVTGFTDSVGSDSVNVPLSLARAKAVVSRLAPLLTADHVALVAAGMGSAMPVAPNMNRDGSDDPAGRAMNRRVEIAWALAAPPAPTPVDTASPPTEAGGATSGGSATYSTSAGGVPKATYRVDHVAGVREGGLLALTFDVTCLRAAAAACTTGFAFSVPPYANHVVGDDVSGVTLIDPGDHSTRPVVADDAFLALVGGIGYETAPGVTCHEWAYFAPVSGATATLVIPYGGPHITVPVS